ncbi:MAG: hypothetical protein IJE68_01310 [Clostridia bacterium]|nr:hypothetical protein [Clostridia bacterium]
METKYNLSQITKTLEKLFDAGFNTDKKILAMKMEDLAKLPNLTSNETLIIIEFKTAIKNRDLIAFLSGNKEKGNDKQ